MRKETLLKTTGRLGSLENTSLSSRITDETAINPIVGIALEVGTSNQELLSQLQNLTVIRGKRSLESHVQQIRSSKQRPSCGDETRDLDIRNKLKEE